MAQERQIRNSRLRLRARLVFLSLAGLVAFPFLLQAEPGLSLRELIAGLENSYSDVRTLKTQFIQKLNAGGGRVRVEKGTLYMARGGRMRWEYREPEEKYFITNKERTYLYVPSEQLVTKSAAKRSGDVRIPFQLLLRRPKLNKIFSKIELVEGEELLDPENFLLRCIPKGKRPGYRQVLLEVTPAFDIRRIVLHYPGGHVMEFQFSRFRRNIPMADSLFRFVPPEGARVIEEIP